jgi:hypothetical protein
LLKRFVEVKHVVEVLAAILGARFHLADLDEVVNDLAEIAGTGNAPVVQHLLGQPAILLVRKLPHRFAQLLARDVPLKLRLGIVVISIDARYGRLDPESELLLGVAQRFEDKQIGVEPVSPVMAQKFGDGMVGVEHRLLCRRGGGGAADA